MSSGAECDFVKVKPGEWKYRLQRWPYGDFDEYDSYGPFPTFTAALAHLDANHQNPGGFSTMTHPDHVHNGEQIDNEWSDTKEWTCCGDSVAA